MTWLKIDVVLGKVREKDWANASATPKLFTGTWDPTWVVTATKVWDLYFDTVSGNLYFSQAATDSNRAEINYMTS
jgi:hypothetical protein